MFVFELWQEHELEGADVPLARSFFLDAIEKYLKTYLSLDSGQYEVVMADVIKRVDKIPDEELLPRAFVEQI